MLGLSPEDSSALMKFVKSMLYFLPASVSLGYIFNVGSFLGMALLAQIVSGLLLLMNYNSLMAFESIMFIMSEVNYGWFFKLFHSNNASFIFVLLYLHLFKGLMYFSYRLTKVWTSGLVMMLFIMGAGFSGYVLVGSQMSYWAAMVITSLISVMPLQGEKLMYFVWGGFGISWVTIQLMLLVHFILPFLTMGVMIFHLHFLHESGSTSELGLHVGESKVPFYPYFWIKDLLNVPVYLLAVVGMLLWPYSLGEVELFEEANFLNSPVHIVPEWYFCWSYCILRSVPSKGMGVVIMFGSIMILFLYPFSISYLPVSMGVSSLVGSVAVSLFILLSVLGMAPIAQPYLLMSLWTVWGYFMFHLMVMGMYLVTTVFFMLSSS